MKKATALILVLVVMIIVGLGVGAVLQVMVSFSQMKIVSISKIRAQYLAEAGIQHALWQCRNGNFSSPVTISVDGVPIVITKDQQPDGSYEITAKVQYPGI